MTDSEVHPIKMQHRHDKLRAAGKCLNGPLEGNVSRNGRVHGEVFRGGRCEACWNAKLASDRESYKRIGRSDRRSLV